MLCLENSASKRKNNKITSIRHKCNKYCSTWIKMRLKIIQLISGYDFESDNTLERFNYNIFIEINANFAQDNILWVCKYFL